MRRVRRLLDEGFTVDQIADEYNATVSNIRKTIREYRLLQLAENLKGLTGSEQQKLSNPDLRTNPYTQFFDLSNVKQYLGLNFSGNGDYTIKPPRREFDAKLKLICTRSSLIVATSYTRTNPEDVLGSDFEKFKVKPTSPATKPPSSQPTLPSAHAPISAHSPNIRQTISLTAFSKA